MNRKLISIRNKKKKIEEKLKDLNAKYKEICDEEIQVENEEIIVTLRRNNISLEELMEKINDRKRERKITETEVRFYEFQAPKGSVATQFIVCSMGIGDTPQQADLAKIP
ncbi:hypothetical protein [Streptococcus dysgalactiae]